MTKYVMDASDCFAMLAFSLFVSLILLLSAICGHYSYNYYISGDIVEAAPLAFFALTASATSRFLLRQYFTFQTLGWKSNPKSLQKMTLILSTIILLASIVIPFGCLSRIEQVFIPIWIAVTILATELACRLLGLFFDLKRVFYGYTLMFAGSILWICIGFTLIVLTYKKAQFNPELTMLYYVNAAIIALGVSLGVFTAVVYGQKILKALFSIPEELSCHSHA